MVDDPADDPVAVIKDILSDGPMMPAQFRKECHRRGVSVKKIAPACRAAGAACIRTDSRPGKGGWLWTLTPTTDRNITTKPNRRGYYSDNLFLNGKEIQIKLADDLQTARKRIVELRKQLDEQKQFEQQRRAVTTNSNGCFSGKPEPIHHQLRQLARLLYRLSASVQKLERK